MYAQSSFENENEKENEKENNINTDIINDIIDEMYNDIDIDDNNDNNDIDYNNVKSIFENSYNEFISFLEFNVLNEDSYDKNENINKYCKLYLNLLYDVIYSKASYQEDFINDKNGDFYEYYKNYITSKNISAVTDLNKIHIELNDINFTVSNLELLQNYVLKFAYIYTELVK